MKEIVFGTLYSLWVPGRPIPKSTQRPPNVKSHNRAVIRRIVETEDRYKPLRQTWGYQEFIATTALNRLPRFSKADPLEISMQIRKEKHEMGDRKNYVAAVEDGLQLARIHGVSIQPVIPNDRQITNSGRVNIVYNAGRDAGILVALQIDPQAADPEWLANHLQSRKKAIEYAALRKIPKNTT